MSASTTASTPVWNNCDKSLDPRVTTTYIATARRIVTPRFPGIPEVGTSVATEHGAGAPQRRFLGHHGPGSFDAVILSCFPSEPNSPLTWSRLNLPPNNLPGANELWSGGPTRGRRSGFLVGRSAETQARWGGERSAAIDVSAAFAHCVAPSSSRSSRVGCVARRGCAMERARRFAQRLRDLDDDPPWHRRAPARIGVSSRPRRRGPRGRRPR